MKKILFAAASLALLAAACNSGNGNYQGAGKTPPGQQQPSVQSSVKVNNPDDAVNLLINNASAESSITTSKDDSDLTASDTTELNSVTEVSNGY